MMTDEELDSFEDACKAALDGMYGYSSKQYLELIAMIRQARAERDWLARDIARSARKNRWDELTWKPEYWLERAAKEAACQEAACQKN